jgi:hypothetical protein
VGARAAFFTGADQESVSVIVKQTNEVDVLREPAAVTDALRRADTAHVLLVITSGAEVMAYQQAGHGRRVAEFDSLTKPARHEADTALAELMQQMRVAGQGFDLWRLDKLSPEARADLPANVSRPLLQRYQALALGTGRLQLAAFLFDSPAAAVGAL